VARQEEEGAQRRKAPAILIASTVGGKVSLLAEDVGVNILAEGQDVELPRRRFRLNIDQTVNRLKFENANTI
jgi:hypothetical protein